MTDRERLGDEQYVRSRWKDTILDGLYLYELTRSYHLRLGDWEYKGLVKFKDVVWKAAADYTDQREQQIREKREEIEFINDSAIADIGYELEAGEIRLRILTTLEAQLEQLTRGMKGASK